MDRYGEEEYQSEKRDEVVIFPPERTGKRKRGQAKVRGSFVALQFPFSRRNVCMLGNSILCFRLAAGGFQRLLKL